MYEKRKNKGKMQEMTRRTKTSAQATRGDSEGRREVPGTIGDGRRAQDWVKGKNGSTLTKKSGEKMKKGFRPLYLKKVNKGQGTRTIPLPEGLHRSDRKKGTCLEARVLCAHRRMDPQKKGTGELRSIG